MQPKPKILVICRHNNGRSQIAAAYLKRLVGEFYDIESAGLEPAERVNPLVVEVMKEEGFDLSENKPQSVFELYKQGILYTNVITVCRDLEGKCPVFPGITKRWYQPFPDPGKVEGSPEEKLSRVREIRDMIKDWLLNPREGSFSFRLLLKNQALTEK